MMKFKIGDTIIHKCSDNTEMKAIGIFKDNYIVIYKARNGLSSFIIPFNRDYQYELLKDKDNNDKS